MAARRGELWQRDQRGVAFPSPLVALSVIAVVMAGLAFVLTGHEPDSEREITSTAASPSPSASPTTRVEPSKPEPPAVHRDRVYVEVYNNSGVSGLAGRVAAKAAKVGWNVVGSDNWYGTIPSSTVYYPKRLSAEAHQLALDLGLRRVVPAVAPMRMDRLTVILTDDAA
ncbi:MAG: LytR C-terminal domain-containing protein [Nocardioidaceae bacterium]